MNRFERGLRRRAVSERDAPRRVPPVERMQPPPMPAVEGVDPTGLGTVSPVRDEEERLCDWLIATVPPTATGLPAGRDFADVLRPELRRNADALLLHLPPGTHLSGDLELDWEAEWVQRHGVAGIVCAGDLSLGGDLLNRGSDAGPFLLVGGSLRLRNLLKGGSRMIVLGDLEATGLVVCDYNHGTIRIGGDLVAQAYFVLDQSYWVCGEIRAPVFDDRAEGLREKLVPQVFDHPDDTGPQAEWLWARQRAGLPVVKSDREA